MASRRSRPSPHTADDAQEMRRLREMDAFKTHFLNMAAHELSTPLTPTRLQLHLLLSGALGPLDPRQAQAVRIAERNVNRLAALVRELLEVARLQGGGLRFAVETFPLGPAVMETVDAYAEAARGIGVHLAADVQGDIVLHTDRERLVQVLMNLVSNALKFTGEGGRVTVTARAAPEGDAVQIEVADSGRGLTPEQIAQLFQPFAQVHDPMAITTPGAGLGLYICRTLLDAMGGTITALSDGPGHGATFRVVLPVSHEAPPVRPWPAAVQSSGSAEAKRRLRELI